MGIAPGQLLASRYRAEALLGRGGMGEVWRCFDLDEKRTVAVKTVLQKHVSEPWVRRLFHSEVVAVARLGHPGIVEIYDLLQDDDGTSLLVMAFRKGQPLHEAIPRTPSWPLVRTILVQMLEALAHAHARAVLHLDIKPANILVDVASNAKTTIVDFGIARVKRPGRGAESWLEKATVFGTLEYMAPEQFRGQLAKFGPWTDLYSIGLIAYELCHGEVPFAGEDPLAAARQRATTTAPSLVPRGIAVPVGFKDLSARLLALTPSQRPQCAADVLAELERIDPHGAFDLGTVDPSGVDALADGASTKRAHDALTLGVPPSWRGRSQAETLEAPVDPAKRSDTPTLDALAARSLRSAAPTIDTPVETTASDEITSAPTLHALTLPSDGGPVSVGVRVAPPSSRRIRVQDAEHAFTSDGAAPTPGAYGLFGLRELPVLGRLEERRALWGAVGKTAIENKTCAVELVGPAGTGKSRLARDAAERALELGLATVLTTHWSASASPDEGLRGLVENALESRGSRDEDFDARLAFWLERTSSAAGSFAREAKVFLRPERDAAPDAGLPVRVAAELVVRAASMRPVLLWLDDVQWSRGEAAALVRALADLDPPPALCVLTTVREDELGDGVQHATLVAALEKLARAGEREAARVVRVPMKPLDAEATRSLVRGLLDLESELSDLIARRAEGNPLFVTQLVGQLVGERAIERKGGKYGLARALSADTALPADMEAVWARRVAVSGALERDLQSLALVRAHVSAEVLEALARLADPTFDASVERALASGLLRKDGELFAFSHGLLRDYLVRSIPRDVKVGLHEKAAEALKPLVGKDDVQEERARHLHAAGARDVALEAMLDAAMWSWRRLERDVRRVRLDALHDWATKHGAQAMRARALAELAFLDAEKGDFVPANAAIEESTQVQEARAMPNLAAWIHFRCAQVVRLQGRVVDGGRASQIAAEFARAGDEPEVEALAILQLALDANRQGDRSRAQPLFESSANAARRAGNRGTEAHVLMLKSGLETPSGRERALRAAIEIAKTAGALRTEIMARQILAHVLWELGRREEARVVAKEVSTEASRRELRQTVSLTEVQLSCWAIDEGEWKVARVHRERASAWGALKGAAPERALMAGMDLVLAVADGDGELVDTAIATVLREGRGYRERDFQKLLARAREVGGARFSDGLSRLDDIQVRDFT